MTAPLAIARPPRDVVALVGPDATSFLQSLVSQDLDGLGDGGSVRSLLLTPQGKLDVDFALVRAGDGWWLACEGGFGEQLSGSLTRFKIRVQVEIAPRPDLRVLAVRRGEPHPAARTRVLPARWAGKAYDLVGEAGDVEEAERELMAAGAERWDDDEYEARRIAAGVPRQGRDLDEKTIPQEAFLERDAVSFEKGCFLGQELVCRIDTRGHVNRYLRSITSIEGGRPPEGAEIIAGEKVVGTVTSTVELADHTPAAMGYVRREVEPPAEVALRWDDGECRAVTTVLASVGAL